MNNEIHPLISHISSPKARFDVMKRDWKELTFAASRMPVVANNSYQSALVTQFLEDGAVTKLQDKFAALRCFSRSFSTDPMKSLAPAQVKFVTGTDGVTQQNPTNFEAGDTTIANVLLTPVHYSRGFHITQDELESGLRMENLLDANLATFSDAIIQAATAPITAANFPTTAIVRRPGDFNWADMTGAWGTLKKSKTRNAVLDGEYLAQIIDVPVQLQRSGAEAGTEWKAFGFENVALNTNWTGADPNVRGFFCGPTAIGCLAGFPIDAPSPNRENPLETRTMTIPGIDLSIQVNSWFSVSQRAAWKSFDLVFAAGVLDSTAGIILRSA